MNNVLAEHGRKIMIGFCCLCVVIGVAFAVGGKFKLDNGANLSRENKLKIEQLTNDVKDLEKAKEAGLSDIAAYKNSAAVAGNAVASAQTTLAGLTLPAQSSKITEIANNIKNYGTDKSLVAPWFYYTASNVSATWSFKSAYSFKADKIKVIWICAQNASDRVLAYATAQYDANTNQFGHVNVYQTAIGDSYHLAKGDAKYKEAIDEALANVEVK